jgi:hypothetical protein
MADGAASKVSKGKASTKTKERSPEDPAHVSSTDFHAGILSLQRHAGNRAVGQILQNTEDLSKNSQGLPPIVRSVLSSNSGKPLDPETRSYMESRFRDDFSQVRVHTDTNAAESAKTVSADAYTVKQDIVFDAGNYAPDTSTGQRLLAHELAHVVQQRRSSDSLSVTSSDYSLEQGADRAASDVAQGHDVVKVSGISGATLARQEASGKVTAEAPLIKIEQTSDLLMEVYIDGLHLATIRSGQSGKLGKVEIIATRNQERERFVEIKVDAKDMVEDHNPLGDGPHRLIYLRVLHRAVKPLVSKPPISKSSQVKSPEPEPEIKQEGQGSAKAEQQPAKPGISEKVKTLLAHLVQEKWDVDSLAAELTDGEMRGLTLADRINLIQDIAEGYVVGDEDEETIIRLIATVPEADANGLINALRAKGSKLTQTLESAIDGEEYKKYHTTLRELYFKNLKTDTPQAASQKMDEAKVLPWADPGLIKGLYNIRFHYDEIKFTKDGKISFVFWTSVLVFSQKSQKFEVDPYEMIAVRFLADEELEGAQKGRIVYMPAVNLLNLYNKQFRQEMALAADTAMIVSGVGGVVSATTKLGRAIAILDTIIGSASITLVDFRGDIMKLKYGPEFLSAWDKFTFLYTIYTGYRVVKELPKVIKQLKDLYKRFKMESGGLLDPKTAAELEKQMAELTRQVDDVEREIKAEGSTGKSQSGSSSQNPGSSPNEAPKTTESTKPTTPEAPKSTDATEPALGDTTKPTAPVKPSPAAESPKTDGSQPKPDTATATAPKAEATKSPQKLPLSPEEVKTAIWSLGKLKSMQNLLKRMESAKLTFLDLGIKSEEELLEFVGKNPEAAITELNERIDVKGVIAQQTGVASNKAKIDFEATEKSGGGGGASSPAIGDAGVAQSIEKALKQGEVVLGEQIHVLVEISPGQFKEVIPDLVVLDKAGNLKFIDAKKGMGAKLTDNQKIGYPIIRAKGCIPFGPNAEKALSKIGWKPGNPLPKMQVQIDPWL